MTAAVEAAGYELQPKRPLHIGAAVGSGVHAAAAFMLTQKMQADNLGSEQEAVDRAIAEFDERASEEGLTFDDVTVNVAAAQRQMQRMTHSYRTHLAPTLQPLLVEQRLVADVGDDTLLSGQGDVLTQGQDGGIHDIKSGRARRANAAQYGAYRLIFQAHGFHVSSIVEDFVPRARLSIEQPPPQSTSIAIDAATEQAVAVIEDIKRSVAEFERRLRDGDGAPHAAFRANPASVLCSRQFCRAHGTRFCRAHLTT
jgi:hypothetical protein